MRFVCDENFGLPLVEALRPLFALHDPPVLIESTVALYAAGMGDAELVANLKADGGVLISADLGRRNWGPKMPVLCQQNGITHVLLSTTIHSLKRFQKARSLVLLLPEIFSQVSTAAPGQRFQIHLNNQGVPAFRRTAIQSPAQATSPQQSAPPGAAFASEF